MRMKQGTHCKRMNHGVSFIEFVKPSHCMQKENVLCLVQEVATMANEDKKDFNAMLHDSKDKIGRASCRERV